MLDILLKYKKSLIVLVTTLSLSHSVSFKNICLQGFSLFFAAFYSTCISTGCFVFFSTIPCSAARAVNGPNVRWVCTQFYLRAKSKRELSWSDTWMPRLTLWESLYKSHLQNYVPGSK